MLESLAYSNFYSPRPQPINPAVFFDLVKIRRLTDDATSLSVRASNGTTAAALSSSMKSSNGYLNGNDAELLGIGSGRGGGAAKLSKERKFRMREHATAKLSKAYHLDEIAASVATMQSASALEEVAHHVLQRDQDDFDATYVHFFHEKIPSRALAQCTSLQPLSSIIHKNPTDPALYRTRSVVRIFKDDFVGATKDLTDGLAVHRLYHADHKNEQKDLILARDAVKSSSDGVVDESHQPSSMESQLLFHRAGAYLTLACQNIAAAIKTPVNPDSRPLEADIVPPLESAEQKDETKLRTEARKLVRTYAKRALRDYTAFLSHFEYTPGISAEFTEAFLQKVGEMNGSTNEKSRSERLLDLGSCSQHGLSDALIKHEQRRKKLSDDGFSQIPKPVVYKVSDLFNAVPPNGLSSYPDDETAARAHPVFNLPDFSEAVTYHPLLTDVLHSLLLCHCLVQTSQKELLRHAYMAARVARVCDGYPIFLAARSPARADWIEVLRRSNGWLNLGQSWETLSTKSASRGRKGSTSAEGDNNELKAEGQDSRLDRIKQEAVRGALSDERVIDESTFRASVRAREARAITEEDEEMRKEYHKILPSRSHPAYSELKMATNGKDAGRTRPSNGTKGHPIMTERADAVARWIRDAPPPGSTGESSSQRRRAGNATRKSRLRKLTSDVSTISVSNSVDDDLSGLERSVDGLHTPS